MFFLLNKKSSFVRKTRQKVDISEFWEQKMYNVLRNIIVYIARVFNLNAQKISFNYAENGWENGTMMRFL